MIDNTDKILLEALQKNGRTKRNQLAEFSGLSVPAVSDRLRKLETGGFIRTYTTVLEPKLFGLDITAFITVSMESSKYYQGFIEKSLKLHDILECHSITGEGTHMLKVRTSDTTSLESLLSKIQSWPGVSGTRTNVVLSSPKETTNIPIQITK
jgi:Lrp/AsnC family transcriptional regulator, leucine-responsive regulatory protein